MSLDKQQIISANSADHGMPAVCQDASAAVPVIVGKPSRSERVREVRVKVRFRIALVDEFPLRRGSTLNLLRLHVSKGTAAFSSVDELFSQAPVRADSPECTILSVGGRSVTEAPLADALRRLGQLGNAPGRRSLIILSDLDAAEEVVASFRAGARGFIPTSLDPGHVIAAIRFVLAGGAFIPAKAQLRTYRQASPESRPAPCPDQVVVQNPHQWPPRQLAVLRLLGEGKTNKHIAGALGMEEGTVKVHVRHIMRKLGVTNRTQVALYVRRLEAVTPAVGHNPASLLARGTEAPAGEALIN